MSHVHVLLKWTVRPLVTAHRLIDDVVVMQVKPLVRRWLRRQPISGRHSPSRDTVSAILQLQTTPPAQLVLNPRSTADQQLVRFIKKIIKIYSPSGNFAERAKLLTLIGLMIELIADTCVFH